jgi:ankyrin repeat protein
MLEQPGIDLCSRDKSGLSPFATAMTFKNNKAAQKILQLEPQAAEQYDSRGRNFLHTAILKGDLESVLFLISIPVNVHSKTQDQHELSPLLLAVQKGQAMMIRNLILAGASVHDKTPSQQSALQLASEADLPEVCSILLGEGIDYSSVDSRGNNALHMAVKEGHLDVIRTLLTESHIDAEATNAKGRNPLHILANFAQDNVVAIFDLFLECMPTYPLDKVDGDGNTRNYILLFV